MEIESSHPFAPSLANLLQQEKTHRQENASLESAKVLTAIAEQLFEHRLYDELFF